MPTMATASTAYIAHVVEQIQHNIAFLVDQQQLTQEDADLITSRLPGGEQQQTQQVIHSPLAPRLPNASTGTIKRAIPPPPASAAPARSNQARAIWTYEGGDADDLRFNAGEIIEIVEETNPDWWTGRCNGKEGLFPSNHVEKITSNAPAMPARTISAPAQTQFGGMNEKNGLGGTAVQTKKAYKPFMAAHHGADAPPPVPGSVNSVGLQEAPGQAEKKSKYGKYGNTMAHSAAGGVGFGAGAAIGGGLVRAIF